VTAADEHRPAGPERLIGLQRDFRRYLLDGDRAVIERVADSPGAVRDAASKQGDGSGEPLTPEVRLSIYHNAYFSRLTEVLQNDYPVLHYLLGEKHFYTLADFYIREHPSTSFSLREFGAHLAGFMGEAAMGGLSDDWNDPHWAEMARLEWCFVDAFDLGAEQRAGAADAAAIAPEAWPGMTVSLHDSVQLLECEWNVLPRWQTVTEGGHLGGDQADAPVAVADGVADVGCTDWCEASTPSPGVDVAAIPAAEVLSPRVAVLIWRNGIQTVYRPLAVDEAAMLRLAMNGGDFAGFCERIGPWHADAAVPMRAAAILKKWLDDGMVSRLGG